MGPWGSCAILGQGVHRWGYEHRSRMEDGKHKIYISRGKPKTFQKNTRRKNISNEWEVRKNGLHCFLNLMTQIRPDLGRIEKWILRKAFDDEERPFLPKVTFLYTSVRSSWSSGVINMFFFYTCSIFCTGRRSSLVMVLGIAGLMAWRIMQPQM